MSGFSPTQPFPDSNPFAAPVYSGGMGPEHAVVVHPVVQFGIWTIFGGIATLLLLALVVTAVMAFFTEIFTRQTFSESEHMAIGTFAVVASIAQLAAYLAIFVGECLCAGAPVRAGRYQAIAAVVMQAISGVLLFAGAVMTVVEAENMAGDEEPRFNLSTGVQLASICIGYISMFVFLQFLGKLNAYVGNPSNEKLASWTRGGLVWILMLCGITVAIAVASAQNVGNGDQVALLLPVLMVIAGFIGLATLYMFMRLLPATSAAVGAAREKAKGFAPLDLSNASEPTLLQ